jgi:hypothetical protein
MKNKTILGILIASMLQNMGCMPAKRNEQLSKTKSGCIESILSMGVAQNPKSIIRAPPTSEMFKRYEQFLFSSDNSEGKTYITGEIIQLFEESQNGREYITIYDAKEAKYYTIARSFKSPNDYKIGNIRTFELYVPQK